MCLYIVIFGKIILHSKQLGALGVVQIGDFIGEELLQEKGNNNRQESAYSEGDSYLLEWQMDDWKKIKDIFSIMGLRKDFMILENHMKKCANQKKVWRSYKSRITGEKY